MFLDHLTYVRYLAGILPKETEYTVCRAIGRIAFVIYVFLLVEGYQKTSDKGKYLSRLITFAAISQIPFATAFTAGNYRLTAAAGFSIAPVYSGIRAILYIAILVLLIVVYWLIIREGRFDISCLWLIASMVIGSADLSIGGIQILNTQKLNVFYTLANGMLLMMLYDYVSDTQKVQGAKLAAVLALAADMVVIQTRADYGIVGVVLILLLYLTRNSRILQIFAIAVWSCAQYSGKTAYICGALAAIVPIILYNGKLGPKAKVLFYWFYPMHLVALCLIYAVLRS